MRINLIFLTIIASLILIATLVSANGLQDFTNIVFNNNLGTVEANHVTVNLKEGWNLLPLKFVAEAAGRYWANYEEGVTCNQEVFQHVWFYSPLTKNYYHFPTDEDDPLETIDDWRYPKTRGNDFLLNEFQNKYYHIYAGSAWIYSENNCILEGDDGVGLVALHSSNETQDISYDYEDLVLKKGWNLIPIDFLMVSTGKSFGDIFEPCDVIKFNIWDNMNQEWQISKEEETEMLPAFKNESPTIGDIFKTLAIKTNSDCRIGENILSLGVGV